MTGLHCFVRITCRLKLYRFAVLLLTVSLILGQLTFGVHFPCNRQQSQQLRNQTHEIDLRPFLLSEIFQTDLICFKYLWLYQDAGYCSSYLYIFTYRDIHEKINVLNASHYNEKLFLLVITKLKSIDLKSRSIRPRNISKKRLMA